MSNQTTNPSNPTNNRKNLFECSCCHKIFEWSDQKIDKGKAVSPCCESGMSMVQLTNENDERYMNFVSELFSFDKRPEYRKYS